MEEVRDSCFFIISSPALLFAFLQEVFYPILSSSINQTYSYDDDESIQLSRNLNFLFEEYKLKLSLRKGVTCFLVFSIGIDEIDMTLLQSSSLQFYFYSFYEYQPLQLMCQQVFKKVRANQSEYVFSILLNWFYRHSFFTCFLL